MSAPTANYCEPDAELVAACREWLCGTISRYDVGDPIQFTELAAFVRSRIEQATAAIVKECTDSINSCAKVLAEREQARAVAEARLAATEEFRRELVGGTLPHEEKDLTMQIKTVLMWADKRIRELRQLAEAQGRGTEGGGE